MDNLTLLDYDKGLAEIVRALSENESQYFIFSPKNIQLGLGAKCTLQNKVALLTTAQGLFLVPKSQSNFFPALYTGDGSIENTVITNFLPAPNGDVKPNITFRWKAEKTFTFGNSWYHGANHYTHYESGVNLKLKNALPIQTINKLVYSGNEVGLEVIIGMTPYITHMSAWELTIQNMFNQKRKRKIEYKIEKLPGLANFYLLKHNYPLNGTVQYIPVDLKNISTNLLPAQK
jgi:hypothetical protein